MKKTKLLLILSLFLLCSCNEVTKENYHEKFKEAKMLSENKNYEESLSLLQKIIIISPQFDSAFIEIANLYLILGKIVLAEDAINRALQINPINIEAKYVKGLISYYTSTLNESLDIFNNITRFKSNSYYLLATYQKCLIYKSLRENENALIEVEKLIEMDSLDPEFLVIKAELIYQNNIYKIIQDSLSLCKLNNDNILANEVYKRNKASYGDDGWFVPDFWSANKLYREAISIDDNYAPAYQGLSEINEDKRFYKDALKWIEVALSINPENEEYLLQRAYLFKSMKETERAMEDANKLIELYPQSPNGYFVREYIYRELLNDLEAAEKDQKISNKLIKERGFLK